MEEKNKDICNNISKALEIVQSKLKPYQAIVKVTKDFRQKYSNIFSEYNKIATDIVRNLTINFDFGFLGEVSKTLKKYNERTKQVFEKTKKHQWFYNRYLITHLNIDIDNRIIRIKSEKRFDKLMIETHEQVLDSIFDEIKKIEKEDNVKTFIEEVKFLYIHKKYFSCISTCQPIIEHIITRLNSNTRITASKDIRNLVKDKSVEKQFMSLYNNTVSDLFEQYYYCDDKKYDIDSSIPNRHFIAHAFGFNFVSKKGALNMILLLSNLYTYVYLLKL